MKPKQISNYFKHVRLKIRYNPFPQIILDSLAKVGITIQPYYLCREGISGNLLPYLKTDFNDYDFEFLGPEDMKPISDIPYRVLSEKQLLARLDESKVCFAAKHRGEIAAFTWCDLRHCGSKFLRFSLKESEAYLFDAFTLNSFRGKGIAPYLRYRIYEELSKSGIKSFYSISERFNLSSIKFKKKLNATLVGRGMFIEIFGRWEFRSKLIKMQESQHFLEGFKSFV